MFTEEQINQLKELLAPLENRMANIEKGQEELRKGQEYLGSGQKDLQRGQEGLSRRIGNLERGQEGLSSRIGNLERGQENSQRDQQDLRLQFEAHRKESSQEHQEMVKVIVDSIDTGQEHLDKRVTRIEKHLNLPPLE